MCWRCSVALRSPGRFWRPGIKKHVFPSSTAPLLPVNPWHAMTWSVKHRLSNFIRYALQIMFLVMSVFLLPFCPLLRLHEGKFCDSCADSHLRLLMLHFGSQITCMAQGKACKRRGQPCLMPVSYHLCCAFFTLITVPAEVCVWAAIARCTRDQSVASRITTNGVAKK